MDTRKDISADLMRLKTSFLVMSLLPFIGASAQSFSLIGRWKIDFVFSGGEEHAVEFNAAASGKGTFLLLDPMSSLLPLPEPSKADWRHMGRRQVQFSGVIEFPIGNVGRSPGHLTFKGNFNSPNSIAGIVSFYRQEQDPRDPRTLPAQKGKFRATRTLAAR